MSQLRAKFEEVPQERIEAVQKAADSDLDRWLIQFVNAETIDEVSADGRPGSGPSPCG